MFLVLIVHSRFEWKLSENCSFTRQTWGKPRFRVVHAMMVNTALYLMSDTTIWHYIVPDIKEEILIYNNPLWNLFCAVDCANSLTNAFSRNSSLTKDGVTAEYARKLLHIRQSILKYVTRNWYPVPMCDLCVSTYPPNFGYSFKVAVYSAVKPIRFPSVLTIDNIDRDQKRKKVSQNSHKPCIP